MRSPIALVPVRLTADAKRRLASELDAVSRVGLMRGLFENVVSVLRDAGLEVVALSSSPVDGDVEVFADPPGGLNACVDAAVSRTHGPWLIVHADLPAVSVGDVERMLAEPGDVVIARAEDGGTNALLLRRPMPVAFGPDSATRHALLARARGFRCRVVDIAGLALDVDGPAALARLGSG